MSNTDQFWIYAEEALLSARQAKTVEDKHALLDLARSWTQAALQSESVARAPPIVPIALECSSQQPVGGFLIVRGVSGSMS